MDNWDRQAAVRTSPRRLVGQAIPGTLFFSPALVPTLGHPLVASLGEERLRALLVHHLYGHLEFTAQLEHRIVNSVTLGLAYQEMGVTLGPDMRFDAHKLYCDEAYHALMAADVKRQVESATGVRPLHEEPPTFLGELETTLGRHNEDHRLLALLLFVVVSETLISGTLRKIPRDHRVVPAVRESVEDHARDEARHHAYFSAILNLVWPQLTDEQKASLGSLVPQFILLFLRPDLRAVTKALTVCGVQPDQTDEVLATSYTQERLIQEARQTGRATIQLFDRVGAMEISEVREAFYTTGILDCPAAQHARKRAQDRGVRP